MSKFMVRGGYLTECEHEEWRAEMARHPLELEELPLLDLWRWIDLHPQVDNDLPLELELERRNS